MKVYSVHLRPGALSPDRDALAIREGFCWPAALFGPLWALAHRMWFAAAGLLGATILLGLAVDWLQPDPATALAFIVGLMAIVGFGANDWRRAALAARGWRHEGLSAANSGDAALHRYFDRSPSATGPGTAR